MWLSVNSKTFRVEGTKSEEDEIRRRNRRAMYLLEKKEKERERDLEQRGYCLDCHVLLTIHHKCPKCGTVWGFHRTNH